jgi:hypothetical protein
MRNEAKFWFFVAGFVILAVLFAGCSGESPPATTVPPTTTVGAKFIAGDIIAKTASSIDTFWLIVKYDSKTDKYERALTFKKSDGTWYRNDDKTELSDRSVTEKIYPSKIAHVSSLLEVPVITATMTAALTTTPIPTTTTTLFPAPTVLNITPNSGIIGATVNITSLTGANFRTGATVKLVRGTSYITGSTVHAVSATNITCVLVIPSYADAGAWNVTVTNPDGQFGKLINGFTVINSTATTQPTTTATTAPPAPTVSSITPSSGIKGTTVSITNLVGTGFQTGAVVNLSRSGNQNITASSVMASPSQIICSIALPSDSATGTWNVMVTNLDGRSGTLSNGFTVTNPAPTVTSITPAVGQNGSVVNITSLSGTGFMTGATVKLYNGTFDIPASNVEVVSSIVITCSFDLTCALPGQWNVIVSNTDNQTSDFADGFTIT